MRKYKINNEFYELKEKYTLKTWGEILQLLNLSKPPEQNLIALLAEDKLKKLLELILDKPINGELYEDDIEEISRVINDFFSREKSLIKNMTSSSTNSTKNTKKQ